MERGEYFLVLVLKVLKSNGGGGGWRVYRGELGECMRRQRYLGYIWWIEEKLKLYVSPFLILIYARARIPV